MSFSLLFLALHFFLAGGYRTFTTHTAFSFRFSLERAVTRILAPRRALLRMVTFPDLVTLAYFRLDTVQVTLRLVPLAEAYSFMLFPRFRLTDFRFIFTLVQIFPKCTVIVASFVAFSLMLWPFFAADVGFLKLFFLP